MFTSSVRDGLIQAGFDPDQFVPSGLNSIRGPCPRCHGTRRFLVFVDLPFPAWYCLCDGCGVKGWLDKVIPGAKFKRPTPETLAQLQEEIEEEKRRIAQARAANLAEFTKTNDRFDEYHLGMSQENRRAWKKAGIPDEWQVYWNLGFVADRVFTHQDLTFKRSALVIPKYDVGWRLVNADYRLIDPPDGVGKYRPEPFLPPAAFITNPERSPWESSLLLIVEGSKKAMVSRVHIPDDTVDIVGIPGVNSWCGVDELARSAGRVIVALDPDAAQGAKNLAAQIGKAAIPIYLPTKIDDGFMEYELTWDMLKTIIRGSKR